MAAQEFVRIDFDGSGKTADPTVNGRRKFRYKHRDLRDLVDATKRPIRDLLDDMWGGWPYLLFYGLRWSDPKISVDKCSELIDMWCESHSDEELPLTSLGDQIRLAFVAAKFIREAKPGEEAPSAEPEGNAPAGQSPASGTG